MGWGVFAESLWRQSEVADAMVSTSPMSELQPASARRGSGVWLISLSPEGILSTLCWKGTGGDGTHPRSA